MSSLQNLEYIDIQESKYKTNVLHSIRSPSAGAEIIGFPQYESIRNSQNKFKPLSPIAGGSSRRNRLVIKNKRRQQLFQSIDRVSKKIGVKQADTNKMIAYSVYNPEDTVTIQNALKEKSSNYGKAIIQNIIIKGAKNAQINSKLAKHSQMQTLHEKLSNTDYKSKDDEFFIKSDTDFAPAILADQKCTKSQKIQDDLSLSKLLKNKKQREMQTLQMHNRILYLQNEESKKLRKIEDSRKQAQTILNNSLEKKNIQIQIKQVRDKKAQAIAELVAKNKEKMEENSYAQIYLKERVTNAENIRYEKKKLEKIKIKQEIKQVRQNIEKRESVNNKLIIQDLAKLIKMNQRKPSQDKDVIINKHILAIQQKEKQIKKLINLEKMFILRLRNTQIVEGEAQQEIQNLDGIRQQIKGVNNMDELLKLMENYREMKESISPTVVRKQKKSLSPTMVTRRVIKPKVEKAKSIQVEQLPVEPQVIEESDTPVIEPEPVQEKLPTEPAPNMLEIFKDNLKKEIDSKIKETKEAWDRLDADKVTDGESNSQADLDYSKSIKTPRGSSFQHQNTFQMEPEMITEPIEEENSQQMSSRRISKDDQDFIKKNMKIYNAYESKFIKPTRTISSSLNNTQTKSSLSQQKNSQKEQKLEPSLSKKEVKIESTLPKNSQQQSKLHKISKEKGNKKTISLLENKDKSYKTKEILEKQAQEIENLTQKLSNSITKLHKNDPSDILINMNVAAPGSRMLNDASAQQLNYIYEEDLENENENE